MFPDTWAHKHAFTVFANFASAAVLDSLKTRNLKVVIDVSAGLSACCNLCCQDMPAYARLANKLLAEQGEASIDILQSVFDSFRQQGNDCLGLNMVMIPLMQ